MDLTKKDRVIIANQLRILEKLCPDKAKDYDDYRKVIEYGFKGEYDRTSGVSDTELSEKKCKEVFNVLNMYVVITRSYNRIKDQTDLSVDDVKFPGYDGNNEVKQCSYSNYLIIDCGRFDELMHDEKVREFNNHLPTISSYESMLDLWDKYPDKSRLNEEQIKELLSHSPSCPRSRVGMQTDVTLS